MDMQEMIKAVKDYAALNYDRNGWDYVVEAYEDEDIEFILLDNIYCKGKKIGVPRSANGAIAKVRIVVQNLNDLREEISATEF